MFSHVMVGTNDLDRARTFYDALLSAPGVRAAMIDGHRIFNIANGGIFSVSLPINGQPATPANGGTSCEDPPGVREGGMGKMYLAYLRDVDGNKLCALHRMG